MHRFPIFFIAIGLVVAERPRLALTKPELPAAGHEFANPIDGFVKQYFDKRGIELAPPVSDALFARRAYLDLWGLPPSPEELAGFLADRAADKRERLIDKLLADRRRYAEHWISFWNDLLRNDEGVVYHGMRQSISKWLRQALEDNLPYDRFVQALLDPAQPGDPEGFLIGVNWRGDVSASQTPAMQAAQNSAQVFLGINLKCAACHDSFVNRWKLRDTYGLASFFAGEPLELVRCDVKLGAKAEAKFLYPELGGVATDAPLKEKRAAAARLFTTPQNGRLPRTLVNRYWKRLFGRGLVAPVDDMDAEPWHPELLDWLASDFVEHGYDLKQLLQRIMTSRAYQLPAAHVEKVEKTYTFRGLLLRRLTAEQFVDGISAITGEWRVLRPREPAAATYAREWQLKSSALTRALGRPIRDQVYTDRASEATTLQAIEAVNGEDMADLLHRGALRMTGRLATPPANRFDSGVLSTGSATIDIDITGAHELRLILEDVDSYDAQRVVAGWMEGRLVGDHGETELKPNAPAKAGTVQVRGQAARKALVTPLGAELVYEIADQGFRRFQAVVGVDEKSLQSDISPRVRFFVFTEEPDRKHLVKVAGEPPVPWYREKYTADSLITRLYRHALARDPSAEERRVAREFLAGGDARTNGDAKEAISTAGLEDLLWAVFLSPEYQFVH